MSFTWANPRFIFPKPADITVLCIHSEALHKAKTPIFIITISMVMEKPIRTGGIMQKPMASSEIILPDKCKPTKPCHDFEPWHGSFTGFFDKPSLRFQRIFAV